MTTLRALAADPDRTPYAINVLAPVIWRKRRRWRSVSARCPRFPTSSPCRACCRPSRRRSSRPLPTLLLSSNPLSQDAARRPAALRRGAPDEAGRHPGGIAERLSTKPGRNRHRSRCCGWRRPLAELKAATPEVRARAQAAVAVPLQATLDQIRSELKAGPLTISTLPPDLVADWMTKDGRVRLQVLPHAGRTDNESLRRFAAAVQEVAPNATGAPISTSASADTVVEAFLQAGAYSGRRHHPAAGRGAATGS